MKKNGKMTDHYDGKTMIDTYSATGRKLGVRYVTANSNVYEACCDNFIYRFGSLKRVLVDGGYITLSGGTPHYHFYLRDHLGNNRMVVDASNAAEEVSHYYPYGGLFGESTNGSVQPYKYGGKELDRTDGIDLYDYGARRMDAKIGARFTTMDPLCEKYYSFSPYAYCAGNPVNLVDPDGERIYMLFYTTGNKDGGDDSFKDAAMTRKYDIEHSKDFNKNQDVVVMRNISDLGTLDDMVNTIVDTYSSTYGKTAEFSMWSHSALDGPIGGEQSSSDGTGYNQMSLKGWSKINFNWDSQASANFFGCNSGTKPESGKESFTTNLSSLDNFRDVNVYGQTSYAYPSRYTDVRYTSYQMLLGIRSFPTYYVGGRKGEGITSFFSTTSAIPMSKSRNGISTKGRYIQKGRKYYR